MNTNYTGKSRTVRNLLLSVLLFLTCGGAFAATQEQREPVIETPDVKAALDNTGKNRQETIYGLLILSACLFVIRQIRGVGKHAQGTLFIIYYISFIALCILELYYFLGIRDDSPLWFCSPQKVGWQWTVINFILFAVLLMSRIRSFIDINLSFNPYVDYRTGIYSFFYGMMLFLPVALLWNMDKAKWIMGAVGVCQIIQIFYIIRGNYPHIGKIFACLAVYIVGLFALFAVLMYFMAMLLVVVVCIFFIYMMPSLSRYRYIERD
jgi:hypothetical protein